MVLLFLHLEILKVIALKRLQTIENCYYVWQISIDIFDLTIFLELDCKTCISKFEQNGGCDCFHNKNCDHKKRVPEGCFHCGKQGGKYCQTKLGNC